MPTRTSTPGSYQRTALASGFPLKRRTSSSLLRSMPLPPSSVDQAKFGSKGDDRYQGCRLGKRVIGVVEPTALPETRIGEVPMMAAQNPEICRHWHRQGRVRAGHLHVVERVNF